MRVMTWRALSISTYLAARKDVVHTRRAVARRSGQLTGPGQSFSSQLNFSRHSCHLFTQLTQSNPNFIPIRCCQWSCFQ